MRPRNSAAMRLARLFELQEQRMYRIAYAILHDEGQAEDAVMAAFESIVRNAKIPNDPSSLEAARLTTVAVRNAAIDQYRKNSRERQRTCSIPESMATPDPSESPERAAIAQAGFDELLQPLSQSQQNVLRERFGRGSSVRETAQKLGISETNVRKRQQRAIAEIRMMKGVDNG